MEGSFHKKFILPEALHSGPGTQSYAKFSEMCRWDSGSTVGDFDGHSKRVLSCDFKPTRPFRIVTCGEDFLANFYEGPPFKFKHSIRSAVKSDIHILLLSHLLEHVLS
jgi:hypothetical protein